MISHDLDKPGAQDYEKLIGRLKQLGATRILYSQWLLKFGANAAAIENDLMNYINPATDSFLVIALSRDTSWNNLMISDDADFRAWLNG